MRTPHSESYLYATLNTLLKRTRLTERLRYLRSKSLLSYISLDIYGDF